MAKDYKVNIRGISGWNDDTQAEFTRLHERVKELEAAVTAAYAECALQNACTKPAVVPVRDLLAPVLNTAHCDECESDIPASEAAEHGMETPEDRLAALKVAALAGKVAFAPENRGGFVVQWSEPDTGFGELTVWMNADGTIELDDECSSDEFVKAILLAVFEQGETLSNKRERFDKGPKA